MKATLAEMVGRVWFRFATGILAGIVLLLAGLVALGQADTLPAPPLLPRTGGARLWVLVVEGNDFNRLNVHDMLVQDGFGRASGDQAGARTAV